MWLFRSNKASSLTDVELIAAYKTSRDKNLIGILFDRHAHLVYGICYHYLKNEDACKDAVLTIFEKLFDDLYKYDVNNFSSWIHSVARNHCFSVLNKVKEYISIDEIKEIKEIKAEEEDSEVKLFFEKNLFHLNGAMESINEEQKKCVEMFYLRNLSYADISSATGYSIKQVKSYIQNGKRNLKMYLEKKAGNEKER